VLWTQSELDGAEEMYRKALEVNERLGRLEGIASDYGNLGNVLKARGNLEGAEEMYRTSLEAWQKLGVPHRVAQVQGLLDSLRDQDDPSTSSG
ncbi:MAG: tetratricopeptide repeat protein, partial [Dehalococcoidia bacterium]